MLVRLIVSLLLSDFVLHAPSHHLVEGHPTIQCAQTGASFADDSVNRRAWHWRQGSFTIGAKKFDSKYGGAMYSGFQTKTAVKNLFRNGGEATYCPYSFNDYTGWEIRLCDESDERLKLRIHSVQQQKNGTGELITLPGWLHIEVEVVDPSDSFRMIFAQMYDEYFNAVGEFVKDPKEQCPSNNPAEYVGPTEFQYLPCSAIGAREAKPSQALYMVHSDDLIDKSLKGSPYLPPKEMNRFVHFTWRMNEYWCSRHFRITPMVFVLTTKNIDSWRKVTNEGNTKDGYYDVLRKIGWWKMYRKIPKYWLLPDWIGAADIVNPSRGPLQCDKPITNAPWIRGTFPHTVRQEYFYYLNLYKVSTDPSNNLPIYGSDTCQQNPYYIPEYSTFVGRCEGHEGKDTSHDTLHKCNTNANSKEFQGLNIRFDKYTESVRNLTVVRNEYCNQPCRAPQTAEDAINISGLDAAFTKPVIDIGYGLNHKTRSKSSITRFWRGRKFHGILCLIVTMFLMPLSHFMARYYKETYMLWQYKGIHIWYWAHVGGSMFCLGLLFMGQLAMSKTMDSWGRSKSVYAIFHHSLGWFSIFLHILMVMYGGFRSAQQKRRKIQMIGHSIAGFVIYGWNIVLIMTSTYIPASPSLRRCDRDGFPTGVSVTFWLTLAWMGLDTIFHGFLTFLQFAADRTLRIKRPLYYCPILPILDPNSHEDMRRSGLRKILLYVYLLVCTVFTLGATIHMGVKIQPDGCTIGEMSCKAALGCSRAGLAMCKKLKYARCSGGRHFSLEF